MADQVEKFLDPKNNDSIILYDDKDNVIEFFKIALINLHNKAYAILKPITQFKGLSDDDAFVFTVQKLDGEDVIIAVDNDDIIDDVFEEYYRLIDLPESSDNGN